MLIQLLISFNMQIIGNTGYLLQKQRGFLCISIKIQIKLYLSTNEYQFSLCTRKKEENNTKFNIFYSHLVHVFLHLISNAQVIPKREITISAITLLNFFEIYFIITLCKQLFKLEVFVLLNLKDGYDELPAFPLS